MLLVALGICWGLMYSPVFEGIRKDFSQLKFFRYFFNCALCVGFWSGIIVSAVQNDSKQLLLFKGFEAAAFCYIMEYVRMALDEVITFFHKINN